MRIRSEHTANVQMSMAAAMPAANVGKHFHAPAPKRAKPQQSKGFSFRALFKNGKIGF